MHSPVDELVSVKPPPVFVRFHPVAELEQERWTTAVPLGARHDCSVVFRTR
jgi:hypothetical protein